MKHHNIQNIYNLSGGYNEFINNKKMNNFFLGILQGIIIGIANIIPGISGSTAVILGIYEKIINIITKFDFKLTPI